MCRWWRHLDHAPGKCCFAVERAIGGYELCRCGSVNTPEPSPLISNSPAIWDLVIADMKERDQGGFEKYGTRLRAHNGRRSLVDAYQEALDLAVYLRQAIFEERGF